MLTFDLDFGEILAACGGQIVSVILFRLRNTRTDFAIQRLNDVLNHSSADLSQGAIVIVEDGRHRCAASPSAVKVSDSIAKGKTLNCDELTLLFAPTGALQETSMANGWADEYLLLSAEFDGLIG